MIYELYHVIFCIKYIYIYINLKKKGKKNPFSGIQYFSTMIFNFEYFLFRIRIKTYF